MSPQYLAPWRLTAVGCIKHDFGVRFFAVSSTNPLTGGLFKRHWDEPK